MEQELQDFNNTLLNLFFNNLEYLKNEHPDVFEKVNNLSDKINNGEYKEKYSLEYKQEGYFDIFDLEKDDYIYGFDSYEEADKRREMVNFSQKHSLNLLRVNDSNEDFALMAALGTALPLVDFLNQNIDFKNITFSKIFKFVFIGVGVGVHIHEIYKKIDSMNTLIIEPNLEIFRLSLFTIDYSVFNKGNKKLFLSVADSTVERERNLDIFTAYHSYMNYNIKHHLFWTEYEYILDHLISYYARNYSAAFSYNTVLAVFGRTINFMNKGFKYLKHSYIEENVPLKDKRVLLVGAGPSLDKQIDWIEKNQSKFIIVCVDNMVKKFENHSITPDIVVSIDPGEVVAQFYKTQNKQFLKNSSLVFLSQQHHNVIEEVKDLNCYFTSPFPISDELQLAFSIPNVGTYGFALSLLLGCKELYLIGSDCALAEDGTIYASHADNDTTGHEGVERTSKESVSSVDIIELKGNFGGTVKSTRQISTFKNDYEGFIHSYNKKDYKAYNLSPGAFIEGLIPLKIENIDVESFEEQDKHTNPFFQDISTKVTDLDFENDIKILNSLIRRVEKFKKDKVTSKNDFLQKKLDIMIWILEQKKKMHYTTFGNIFLQFTDLIDVYINYTMNIKQRKLEEKDFLMKIKLYWSTALVELLKDLKAVTKEGSDEK